MAICTGFLPLILAASAFAQGGGYNHPELEWRTITTEHFTITYHGGLERSARAVAAIAEDVYGPVTQLYRFEPDNPVNLVIQDTDDISNGAAYFFDNKIVIWALPMDYDLRGTHNWLRDVVTHEFTHIVSMQAAMKFRRKVPAFYFQYLDYEDEKREDVVRGFPNRLFSYPYSGVIIPLWFAEGIAQYNSGSLHYDYWDSHRDMLLRGRVLNGNLLSLDEMGVFGKRGIGNESVYNQGYAFVRYIAERFGEDALRKITKAFSSLMPTSVARAIEKGTGVSGDQVYKDWVASLDAGYGANIAVVRKNGVSGDELSAGGSSNFFPVYSPDGSRIAYISSGKSAYFSMTDLYVLDTATGKSRKIAPSVTSSPSWSPDGKRLAFARVAEPDGNGSSYYDLFVYDFKTKKEKRLTRGSRGRYPAWQPDGKSIAYASTSDGSGSLKLYHFDGDSESTVIDFAVEGPGRQVFRITWQPDGKRIAFATSKWDGRDIAEIGVDGSGYRILIGSAADERNPCFGSEGDALYYSSDATGIYNVYSLNIRSGEKAMWTNVEGGAFMPSVRGDGEITYSEFRGTGYRLARLRQTAPVDSAAAVYELSYIASVPKSTQDDSNPPVLEDEEYRTTYSTMFVLPRVVYDYGTVKLGAYAFSSELLNKISVVGGFAMNSDYDYDTFARLEYRFMKPTLFIEGYAIAQRSVIDSVQFQPGQYTRVNARYSLLEVDPGVTFMYGGRDEFTLQLSHSRYTASQKSFIRLDDGSFFKNTLKHPYFKGNAVSFSWRHRNVPREPKRYIAPRHGTEWRLAYHRRNDEFFRDFAFDENFNTLKVLYTDYDYNQVDFSGMFYLPATFESSLALDVRGGYISKSVDDFLYYFAGGILGLKGYSYYSIGGEKMALGTATWRLPVWKDINKALVHLYLRDLYAGLFYQWGGAWTGDADFGEFRSTLGWSVRLGTFSYYAFPTAVEVQGAYGSDRFTDPLGNEVGGEWRYYFTLLFDFL